ncbi:MAG: ATP synthase F1 subunit delta [Buchnera aphidicola (Periphyllus lyropictus)]|uniref:ATP synthase F1 subunit delta n=1 Tax=Buchnera aphidicola TaxID=9 RepID=UPI001EC36B11|nr:ATP synthase F1 subunit delta [Buchnera aphidicola]NIH16800.1 ATP synthase F1 subunit delta [Buchnera aphidicola (Periphyllus lyropictus)]USS94696.1 ATP synthase F1 subunit delta [Buchnera aphidicola (Periphyllus lyropictus)]
MINFKDISYSYAKAIFEIALKKKKVNRVKHFLFLLSKISIQNNMRFICSGYLNPMESYNTFKFLLNGFKIKSYEKNFLKILSYNKRLFLLSNIFKEFNFLKKNNKNIIKVILKSSYLINDLQKKIILKFLEKWSFKKIHLKFFIDKSLINGFVIFFPNFTIDYSIKNDLKCLINFLKK